MTYPTRLRRISASAINTIESSLQLGLIIGSSTINLENDIASTGLYLSGNHLGLSIRKTLGINPQLQYRVHYLFQETKGENSAHSTTLTWQEWLADISARVAVNPRWSITLSTGLTAIDTYRQVSGDINETLRMKAEPRFQGQLKLEMNTQPSGRVELVIDRGIFNGARLVFARGF